jgi:hypothetical protein
MKTHCLHYNAHCNALQCFQCPLQCLILSF